MDNPLWQVYLETQFYLMAVEIMYIVKANATNIVFLIKSSSLKI